MIEQYADAEMFLTVCIRRLGEVVCGGSTKPTSVIAVRFRNSILQSKVYSVIIRSQSKHKHRKWSIRSYPKEPQIPVSF